MEKAAGYPATTMKSAGGDNAATSWLANVARKAWFKAAVDEFVELRSFRAGDLDDTVSNRTESLTVDVL